MILLGVGLSLSALAGIPKVVGTGRPVGTHGTRVVVISPRGYYPYGGFGYGYGYNPFFSAYGYNSFYSPYDVYQHRPSKLDLEIQQISNDYRHDIADVRHDKTLSSTERKQAIRDLRHKKQNSIIDAQKKYIKQGDDTIE